MPFLDPSSFLLPSYSEAVNTKEDNIYCAVLYKTKEAANHAIAHKGKLFLYNPSPKRNASPDLFLKVLLCKPEWISITITLSLLHPNSQKRN